jgi:hypothetical protein
MIRHPSFVDLDRVASRRAPRRHSFYAMTGPWPPPLQVPQDLFGGQRFWHVINEAADRGGHTGHQRSLVGEAEHTDRYQLWCLRCDTAAVIIQVRRHTAAWPAGRHA